MDGITTLPQGRWVVVVRTDKIGDMIVTSPLFNALKSHDPALSIVLVASTYNQAVMAHHPAVSAIVVYDPKAGWRERLAFVLAIRRLRPEAAFVLSPGSHGGWLAWASGASQRAGMLMSYRRLQRWLAPWLFTAFEVTDKQALDHGPDTSRHQSAVALRLATRLGFTARSDTPQAAPASLEAMTWAAALAAAQCLTPPPLVVHLGVTWRACGLPEAAVLGLLAALRATFPTHPLWLTVGPADGDYGRALAGEPLPTLTTVFSNQSFDRWSALIAHAAVVITPDTGAVHLASAHHKPVVAVYVPERFNAMTSLFGPWQVPHHSLGQEKLTSDALITAIVNKTKALLMEKS